MPRIYLLIILLLSSTPTYALESYLDMEGFVYTGPVPYSEFVSDWSSGFQKNNNVIGYSWLEAGAHNQRWGLSIVQQQYMQMQLSDDAAEFYYLTQNKLPLDTGRQYQIDYKVEAYTTEGVRLFHRTNPFQNLSLQLGAHVMKGSELQSGYTKGNINASSSSDYDFDNLQVDYRYSEDRIFNGVAESITGEGIALDLAARWAISRNNQLSLQLRNLAGYIKWKDSPRSSGTIESSDKEYDDNGYATVNPTLNGATQTENYRQQLPLLWQSEFEHHYSSRGRLHAQIMGSEVQSFYRVGMSYRVFGKQSLKLLYTLNTQSFSFGYQNEWLSLLMQFDATKLNESHTLGLRLQANYGF